MSRGVKANGNVGPTEYRECITTFKPQPQAELRPAYSKLPPGEPQLCRVRKKIDVVNQWAVCGDEGHNFGL